MEKLPNIKILKIMQESKKIKKGNKKKKKNRRKKILKHSN